MARNRKKSKIIKFLIISTHLNFSQYCIAGLEKNQPDKVVTITFGPNQDRKTVGKERESALKQRAQAEERSESEARMKMQRDREQPNKPAREFTYSCSNHKPPHLVKLADISKEKYKDCTGWFTLSSFQSSEGDGLKKFNRDFK